uniref:NADH-ubiquinone oxidoreductase chain 6 n=1 Tax=Paramarygmus sp. PAR01 TaxID=1205638 RepID=A0A0S2MQV6_9CUCU|nr:NADH deshydrogenase subunit 6 [Paramarygmus sp. PAR01]
MITLMITLNITMTAIFIFMMHPLSMGIILLSQTIIISMITGNLNQNFWFSYILFLIMIGGMLILFMYMTSIASNEKFKFNNKILIIIPATILMMLIMPKKMMMSINNNETFNFNNSIEFMFTLNKFMNSTMLMILLFLMIYLLLALIATVKITNFKQGSIRQMN